MGRKYFLRADSHEQCEQILHQLTALVEIAKKRVDKRTLFEKSQAVVKALYDSPIYLGSVSTLLILVNSILGPFASIYNFMVSFHSLR